jgi:hypothetical protein
VFTKDLGCKNIKSNLRMYHMNLGPNNLVDIGKSKVFDNLTCFNNKFNKSIMYFDKNNNLAYIKEDFAYKYKIDFVRKIEDMNKNNYWLTYSFVNYDFKNNIKKIDTLCKDCIIWSFKFLSQEKTIGVISDTSGNSIFIYNTITKNKKAISIAKGYDNFRIFTRDNEIVLVGTDRNGSNGLFVYLKDEKIIWEKNILLVYNNNKSDLVAFITKDEIIVNYLSIIANKSKESELYKIILTKSY